jgi:hypothetical protein
VPSCRFQVYPTDLAELIPVRTLGNRNAIAPMPVIETKER